jgi:hypothetical protein
MQYSPSSETNACTSSEEIHGLYGTCRFFTVYTRAYQKLRPYAGPFHIIRLKDCGWLSGMQGGIYSTLHTRQSSIQSDKYQVSHRYSYFSWWWAHSHLKHVEKRKKHTKKNCAPSLLYLQDYQPSACSISNGTALVANTVQSCVPLQAKVPDFRPSPLHVMPACNCNSL